MLCAESPGHIWIVENFIVFDFALDAEDMAKLEALDTAQSLFFSHYAPRPSNGS